MTQNRRVTVLFLAVLTLLAGNVFGKDLPNIDALFNAKAKPNSREAVQQRVGRLRRTGLPVQAEERLGVPTFLWLDAAQLASVRPVVNGNERPEVAAARGILGGAGSAYGLSGSDASGAVAEGLINTGKGPVIVKFSQQVNGIPIFREELNVLMNQQLQPVAISGYISSTATPFLSAGESSFSRSESMAAADALKDVTDIGLNASQLVSAGSRDGYELFTVAPTSGVRLSDPIRMRKVYFHLMEGLVPAYYVETSVEILDGVSSEGVFVGNRSFDNYMYVISAVDGSILFRKNMTEDLAGSSTQNALPPGGFTYRVWADPVTGIPYDTPAGNGVHPKLDPVPDGAQYPFLGMNDVQLPNYPFSMNDPWIASGATETVGNNADAYLDLFGLTDAQGNPTTDDGLSPIAPPADPPTGDYRAQITGAGQFLHTHVPDVNHASAEARQGSIQQLFYNVNFLHDWYYDSGFTESMRNAQTDNFGRGGLGNDNVRAEVQDYSGFSNANMSTPSDGGRPRMQMYNFPNKSNVNEILAPASIAGVRSLGVSMPGPQVFDVTADVVIATFDGSNNVTNAAALAGKIAMFDYTSAFSTRVTKLNATSATAILMVWQSGSSANNVVNITGFNTVWTKPLATISFNSAAPIKTQLAVPNTVTMRVHRFADRDGALDNQVVFHEWGHYLSNRLISNSAGLSNNQGRSMGEGWGDFNSMMLTVRPDDINTPSNATWGGVYAMATYATSGVNFNAALNHGYYLGIRRTPYSTDMTNYNAFTFKHITNGQALPVGPPVASGGTNAEVHNSGEIWANTLWECYASLLRDTQGATPRMTFQQAQDRMKVYLVASLALTPAAPTFLEARDAVLAAAYANDYTDYLEFWAAFAKRGMGVGAVAPDRASTTHAGVVESFVVAPDVIVSAGTQLDDSVANCDADGVLDAGEYGKLTVVVKNVGSVPLTATTATVATTTPGVSFPNGATINFPTSDPLASVAASVNVLLAPGTSGMQQVDFQITVTDPTVTGSRSGSASFRVNTDIIPASSSIDSVEAETVASSPWTLDFDPAFGNIAPFSILTVNPMSHQWFGPNGGAPSDNRLVSPVFTVDGSGSVTMQFDHTYSFENTFDGGVIEMSVNGGAWGDVGTNGSGTTNGYTVNLVAGGTNPLNGRKAFTGTLNTVTHVTIVRAVAPGSTVRFRFRTGADDNTAGSGWKIDNIGFSGVVETPFPTLVSDTGCVIATTTTLSPSANPSPLGSSVTFTATVSSSAGAPNSGTVTFFDGGSPIGTGTVSAGVATYTTSSLSAGLHTMSARFEGTTGFMPSTSTSLIENIGKIATGTSLVASSLNPTFSRPVTLTATVTATSGTPTGSVTFYDGATVLGTISLSSGSAAMNISTLSVGVHNITASYVGNASYATSVTAAVTVVVETAKGDLSGEGRSDILLQNSSSNSVAGWLMNGSTLVTGGVINNPTAGWKPAATGDFDGDGMTDILLQNSSSGQIAMWKMNGLTLSGGWVVTTLSTDWRIVGTRDFNKDGKADVILQNNTTREVREWQMNGATIAANGTISTPISGWKVIATANVGGDALILQNTSTGQVARWIINGMTMTSGAVVGSAPANTNVIASGDFNMDGTDDLVLQNTSTRDVIVWSLNGSAAITANNTISTPAAGWEVLGTGDYDANGRADLLLQNSISNAVAMWQTNGTSLLSGAVVTTPASGWRPIVN